MTVWKDPTSGHVETAYLKNWINRHQGKLICLTLFVGSPFPAVEVANARLFGNSQDGFFYMRLTHSQILEWRRRKVINVVFFEVFFSFLCGVIQRRIVFIV
jgi:hypothetical protein